MTEKTNPDQPASVIPERLGKHWFDVANSLRAENDRLKAEVNYWRIEAETDHARWLRLLEDNERLRKAGDAVCSAMILFELKTEEERQERIKAWSAAKYGKPL